jgi:hypothetical protein
MWINIEMRRRRRLSVNSACALLARRWDRYEISHLSVRRLRKLHADVEQRRQDHPSFKEMTDELLAERSGRRRVIRLSATR